MNTQTMSPNRIRKLGINALAKALGHTGMVRFLQLFDTGIGDYTRDRKHWLSQTSVQAIVKEIRKQVDSR